MTIGTDYVVAEKRKSAAALLEMAAAHLEAHLARVIHKKKIKLPSGPWVVVRFELPGVIRVFDLTESELLAESEPGQFRKLR